MKRLETPWGSRVAVVSGTPPEPWFTAGELEIVSGFKLEKRRREWLLSRAAAKSLAIELGLCQSPAACTIDRPRLVINGITSPHFVSLSHSEGFAAAAIGLEPVGIDVQALRELPEEAAHLFLTPEEGLEMERCTLADRILHFWCAKEAAWKRGMGAQKTLTRVPVRLVSQRKNGLLFDSVETAVLDGAIAAVTLSTS